MKTTRGLGSVCFALAAAVILSGGVAQAAIDTKSLLVSGAHTYSNNSTATVFSLNALQPAGSGVFDPFVRIDGKNTATEEGYNSFDDSATLDNHPIGPGDYLLTLNSGILSKTDQLHLLLDSNETGSSASQIILTDLMVVISTNPNKSGSGTFVGQTPVPHDPGDIVAYRMTTTTDNSSGNQFQVLIDSNDRLPVGNGGSGAADLEVVINLAGIVDGLVDANHFLYVYSKFANWDSGYEEWRAVDFGENGDTGGGGGIPEPASLGILGIGAMALLARKRR